ncbi:DNRLRE domain-containing protein [bacterium]|nr:DNRLRE domain-containing protein [bacterium]MBU1652348.1 DNRLRE domain-containing protein [bacterium]
MKLRIVLMLALMGFVCCSFYACTQKDSSVGSEITGGLDNPQEIIIEPENSAFYQIEATTGASPYLLVGEYNSYQTAALLKFVPTSALPDSYAVDSLAIVMYVDSMFNSDPVYIDVIAVNESQEWSEIGVTWSELDSLELGDAISAFEVNSGLDSITIHLPPPSEPVADSTFADSLLRAWDQANSGEKTLLYNNGLYLKATGTVSNLVQLASAEYTISAHQPRLEMYVTVFDTSDTTGTYPLQDTLIVYASSDAFVATDNAGIDDSTRLYLGNAVAHRSMLYFDFQNLLPSYGIGIHRAEVTLHADKENPLNIGKINGSFHLRMQDTTWFDTPETAPIAFGDVPVLSIYDEETGLLTMKINTFVYDWISAPDTNFGFMIKSFDEFLDISRTVFYGLNAPDSLRPEMRIIYIEGGQ